MKKIIWISSFNINKRSGFFSTSYAEYFASDRERDCEYLFIDIEAHPRNQHHAIATFLSTIDSSSDFTIVYNIDNSKDSKLLLHLLKVYPGFVIVHDYTFFDLILSHFNHGTTGTETNRYFQSLYGDDCIKIGNQFALHRSLDIFSNVYLGERELTEHANHLYALLSRDEFLAQKFSNKLQFIEMPYEDLNKEIDNIRNAKSVVIVNDREYGALADSIRRIFGKTKGIWLIRNNANGCGEKILYDEIELHDASFSTFIDELSIDAIIENQRSFYSGLSAWYFVSMQKGIRYFASDSVEARQIHGHNSVIIPKELTIENVFSVLPNEKTITAVLNYEALFNSVHQKVMETYSIISTEIQTKLDAFENSLTDLISEELSLESHDPILGDELCQRAIRQGI